MTTPISAPIPVPPTPRRRWWLEALVMAALVSLVPVVFVGYAYLSARNAWSAAEEETDRLDPHWRLMELDAARANIPDAENSALLIIAVRKKGVGVTVSGKPSYEEIFANVPPTAQFNDQQIQFIRGYLGKIVKPLEEARKLKEMPRGRFPVTFSDDFIGTRIPEHQGAREFAAWLQHDAWLLAQEGQPDAAIESCQAIINTGRSMADDPFVIAHLIRIDLHSRASATLERVLAQGTASDERLAVMQAMLEKEVNESSWLPSIRGERAGHHHFFSNVRNGKLKTNSLRGIGLTFGGAGRFSFDNMLVEMFPSTLLAYYPSHLRLMNRMVEIAKLPIHERQAKLDEWQGEVQASRNPVITLLAPSLAKIHKAETRSQALLRTTLAAIACERYALKHEKWPVDLNVLVKEKLLAAVPRDPTDNQPLRFRRTRDGVVIYAFGFDGKDNQGNIDRDNPSRPGFDTGFRLWDPERRRQNPLPPVALPDASNDGRQ